MDHIVTHLLHLYGRVQGVGLRNFICEYARKHSVTGWVRNRNDGSVEVMLQGNPEHVGAVEEACRQGPAMAHVEHVERYPVDPDIHYDTFEVRYS